MKNATSVQATGEWAGSRTQTTRRLSYVLQVFKRAALISQVFPNDYPALLDPPLPQQPTPQPSPGPNLFQQQPVMGSCQVICFHPRHDLTLARMPADAIRAVLREWSRVYVEEGKKLRAVGDEGYVQFFEVSLQCTLILAESVEQRSDDGCKCATSSWSSLVTQLVSCSRQSC